MSALRWVVSPHDAYCHALDPEQTGGAADRGYVEAQCRHTMPSVTLTFTDMPSGLLCLQCATVAAAELSDPARMGTAL